MPPGIPVATVAIDGGMNAAILAARMLAVSDPELLDRLKAYTAEMKATVQGKDAKLEKLGHKEYMERESVTIQPRQNTKRCCIMLACKQQLLVFVWWLE